MEEKALTQEEKIHALLTSLKKEDKETYNIAKRILGFLYRDVKKDFSDIRKEYEDKKESTELVGVVESVRSNLYEFYIDNENGVLDLFIKMCNDPDKKYLKRFYDGCETFLTMTEEGLYYDYNIFQYVFNMYVMLKAYDVFLKKQDELPVHVPYFEFDAVVSDFENLFIDSKMRIERNYSSYSGASKQTFVTKRKIIDSFIELGKYKNAPEVKERLINAINNIHLVYEYHSLKKYETLIENIKNFYQTVSTYQSSGKKINPSVIELIEKDLFQELEESLIYSNYYNRYEVKNSFNYFLPILVFGERYSFVKNTMPEVETHENIQKDILKYISKMDIDFFESLSENLNQETDSFISLLKIAFDSDSYFELESKLKDIIKASKIYKTNKDEALKLIKELTSNKHKEVIDGVVVDYSESKSINKIVKPKTIFERMTSLHKLIPNYPGALEYEVMINPVYHSNITITEVVSLIHEKFELNKNKAQKELEEERLAKEEALKQQVVEEPKKVKGLGSIFGSFGKNNQDK